MLRQFFLWSEIPDGEAFRKLAQAILNNLHPDEMLSPDAPGKDYGIDDKWTPRNRRKATVFSFKRVGSKQGLLTQVKRDADRLRRRYAQPTRMFTHLWQDVGHYEVWTNQPLGPQDHQSIKDLFEGLPLRVKSRGAKQIEDLTYRFPIVAHTFFGSRRVLLEPLDVFIHRAALSPQLRRHYAVDSPFVERSAVLEEIERGLGPEEKRMVVLSGPGGTGKTRLLIEACRQVASPFLFVNPEVDDPTEHFDELFAARGSVLVIDESQDATTILGFLLSACDRDPRLKDRFRFLIAMRPTVSGLVDPLISRRLGDDAVKRLEIAPLNDSLPVLRQWGYGDGEARALASLGSGNPMWLTFAHEAVQSGADLRNLTRSGVAGHYVRSRLGEIDAEGLEPLLGTLAALAPFNVEAEADLAVAARQSGINPAQVRERLQSLVVAGVVQSGGRLRRIRPDVLADHFLRALLYDESGRPTEANIQLLEAATAGNMPRVVLNLAKAEAASGGDLLAPVVRDVLAQFPGWNNLERISALDLLKALPYVRPADAVRLARLAFEHPRETDNLDMSETSGFPYKVSVEHNQVLEKVTEFVSPALLTEETFLPAIELLEKVVSSYPGSPSAKIAQEKLVQFVRWKETYRALWLATVLEWSLRRIRRILTDRSGLGSAQLVDLASVPPHGVLGLEYRIERFDARTFTYGGGAIDLSEDIRELRGVAWSCVLALIEADWTNAVRKGAAITREAITALLVHSPKYKPDERKLLLAELDLVGPALQRTVESSRDVAVLNSLDELSTWILEVSRPEPARELARKIRDAIRLDPWKDLVVRIFGKPWIRPDESFGSLAKDAFALLDRETMVSELADLTRDNDGEGGKSLGMMFALAHTDPEAARELLRTNLGNGLPATEEQELLSHLFIGLRAVSGADACEIPGVRVHGFLALSGYSRARWNVPADPFGEADRELLRSACSDLRPGSFVRAVEGAIALDDGSGAFVTEISRLALRPVEIRGTELDAILEALYMTLGYKEGLPEEFDLPGLLMQVAAHPDLIRGGQDWRTEILIAKAANASPKFLGEFIQARLHGMRDASELGRTWFFHGHHFSETLALPDEARMEAAGKLLDTTSELGIPVAFVDGIFRDLLRGDVTLASRVLVDRASRTSGEAILHVCAELLGEFGFTEEKLAAVEELLNLSLDVSAEERESVASSLRGALIGFVEIFDHDTSHLDHRKQLTLDFARRSSPLTRSFYYSLAERIQNDIDRDRQEDAERDLE